MRRGPQWSKNEEGHRPCGGGLSGPKARKAPSTMRRGLEWPQGEGGPPAHAAAASVVPKGERPMRPSGGGLGGPKAKEAPSLMWRRPRWS